MAAGHRVEEKLMKKMALPGSVMNSRHTHVVKCSGVEHEGKHQVSNFAFNTSLSGNITWLGSHMNNGIWLL